MDHDEGGHETPLTLHKYLYADANPVDGADPSGNQDSMAELGVEESMSMTLDSMSSISLPSAERAMTQIPDSAPILGAPAKSDYSSSGVVGPGPKCFSGSIELEPPNLRCSSVRHHQR
jgi:hypothetical protein